MYVTEMGLLQTLQQSTCKLKFLVVTEFENAVKRYQNTNNNTEDCRCHQFLSHKKKTPRLPILYKLTEQMWHKYISSVFLLRKGKKCKFIVAARMIWMK